MFRVAADLVLLLHFAFVLFAVVGATLALRWPWMVWLHLPAVAWAAFVEFTGRICPLTPIETELRRLAGEAPYGGGFIDHYVGSLLYPIGLTPQTQTRLGIAVVAINVAIYAAIAWRHGRRSKAQSASIARR